MKNILTITLAEGRLVVEYEGDALSQEEEGARHLFIEPEMVTAYSWTPRARVRPEVLGSHRKSRVGRELTAEDVEEMLSSKWGEALNNKRRSLNL